MTKPDVFKSPNSDTHVIFGEAKIEDLNAQGSASAAEQFKAQAASSAPQGSSAPPGGHVGAAAAPPPAAAQSAPVEEEADAEPIDESGVDPKDIELVMTQSGCSRQKAVSALRSSGGDIVGGALITLGVHRFMCAHASFPGSHHGDDNLEGPSRELNQKLTLSIAVLVN